MAMIANSHNNNVMPPGKKNNHQGFMLMQWAEIRIPRPMQKQIAIVFMADETALISEIPDSSISKSMPLTPVTLLPSTIIWPDQRLFTMINHGNAIGTKLARSNIDRIMLFIVMTFPRLVYWPISQPLRQIKNVRWQIVEILSLGICQWLHQIICCEVCTTCECNVMLSRLLLFAACFRKWLGNCDWPLVALPYVYCIFASDTWKHCLGPVHSR